MLRITGVPERALGNLDEQKIKYVYEKAFDEFDIQFYDLTIEQGRVTCYTHDGSISIDYCGRKAFIEKQDFNELRFI